MNMNYFQDLAGGVHALSDQDIASGGEQLLPPGCVSITATQAVAITNPPRPIADLRASACAAIDAAALAVDGRYLTCGGQQGQIYGQKLDQANAYKSAGYPVLADPLTTTDANYGLYGYVRAYRETLRVSNASATDQNAADQIIGQASRYAIIIGVQREQLRLTGKAQVSAATTEAAVNAARDAAIAALAAL